MAGKEGAGLVALVRGDVDMVSEEEDEEGEDDKMNDEDDGEWEDDADEEITMVDEQENQGTQRSNTLPQAQRSTGKRRTSLLEISGNGDWPTKQLCLRTKDEATKRKGQADVRAEKSKRARTGV
jgi:hypothetical protein